ncbi:hypothetical protein N0V85_008647 [Neurospora sp. IMI 360204]|nr:hypothetical protein N0V85_008647 [Neurospora sp. IMI 360204]
MSLNSPTPTSHGNSSWRMPTQHHTSTFSGQDIGNFEFNEQSNLGNQYPFDLSNVGMNGFIAGEEFAALGGGALENYQDMANVQAVEQEMVERTVGNGNGDATFQANGVEDYFAYVNFEPHSNQDEHASGSATNINQAIDHLGLNSSPYEQNHINGNYLDNPIYHQQTARNVAATSLADATYDQPVNDTAVLDESPSTADHSHSGDSEESQEAPFDAVDDQNEEAGEVDDDDLVGDGLLTSHDDEGEVDDHDLFGYGFLSSHTSDTAGSPGNKRKRAQDEKEDELPSVQRPRQA